MDTKVNNFALAFPVWHRIVRGGWEEAGRRYFGIGLAIGGRRAAGNAVVHMNPGSLCHPVGCNLGIVLSSNHPFSS